jgi:hypothetical protein
METLKSCLNEPSGIGPPSVNARRKKGHVAVFLSLRRYDPDQVRRVPALQRYLSPLREAPLGNV